MSLANDEPKATCHVLALPYPGRGHINPMMNLCKLLSLRCHLLTVTFVVTEEWLGLIGSEQKSENIHFATIPNILLSERVRAANIASFFEAILTKMEEPFEQLLDRLVVPPTIILADVCMPWAVDVGKRRNIPVALLWPMPMTVFSIFYHFNGQLPAELSGRGDELVNYIPGLSLIEISDLPRVLRANDQQIQKLLNLKLNVPNAQYLLFSSIFELEASVFEILNPKFPFPLYSLGPLIPYFDLQNTSASDHPKYLKWLDSQPQGSILYVSFGSVSLVRGSQMEEIVAGLCDSGVKFLLVSCDKASALKAEVCGETGMVVPWCDQLRVLCHPSIGGFWTHSGWNSTLESAFAGVPMICFPIVMDQPTVSKIVSKEWKIGWKVKGSLLGNESLVTRAEIVELVKRFMDPENDERKEMAKRAIQIREICRGAIQEGGSSENNLRSFIHDILK